MSRSMTYISMTGLYYCLPFSRGLTGAIGATEYPDAYEAAASATFSGKLRYESFAKSRRLLQIIAHVPRSLIA
jgi:hypothetical protein